MPNRLLNGLWLYRRDWINGFSLHAVMPDGEVTGWSLMEDEDTPPYSISFISSEIKDGITEVLDNSTDWHLNTQPYTYQFPITLISRELDDEQE